MTPELSDRMKLPVEPPDIAAAHERISAYIRRTPVMEAALAAAPGARVFFKLEFTQHAGSIPQWIDLGTVIVSPGNRHLRHSQSVLARKKQDFGIEAPALDLHVREDLGDGFAVEGFESALRVGVRESKNGAERKIERSA